MKRFDKQGNKNSFNIIVTYNTKDNIELKNILEEAYIWHLKKQLIK